jgi:hypothetical protein
MEVGRDVRSRGCAPTVGEAAQVGGGQLVRHRKAARSSTISTRVGNGSVMWTSRAAVFFMNVRALHPGR